MRYTHNGGQTWSTSNYFFDTVNTTILAISPDAQTSGYVAAGGSSQDISFGPQGPGSFVTNITNGVFVSTNGGSSWFSSGTLGKDVVAVAMYDSVIAQYGLAATADSLLYLSTHVTNAQSPGWTQISFSGGFIKYLKVDQNEDIFAVARKGVYYSTNLGRTWTQLSTTGLYDLATLERIVIDQGDTNRLYLGGKVSVFKSTNRGGSWTDAANTIELMPTSSSAGANGTLLSVSPGYSVIERTTGNGWTNAILGSSTDFRGTRVGYNFHASSAAFATGYHQVSGGTKASLWRSGSGGGSNWTETISGSNTSGKYDGTSTDPVTGARVYAFGKESPDTNLVVSIDTGKGWEKVCVPSNSTNPVSEVLDVAIDSSNHGGQNYSSYVYAAIGDTTLGYKGVWKSTNAGASWPNSPVLSQPIVALGMNPKLAWTVYAAGGSAAAGWNVWKSTNSGAAWTALGTLTQQVTRLMMHPTYPTSANYLWAIVGGTNIYKTTDGGSTWNDVTGGLPGKINDIQGDIQNAALIYAATDKGVYKIDPAPETPLGFIVNGTNCTPCTRSLGPCYAKPTWSQSLEADGYAYEIWRRIDNGSSELVKTVGYGTTSWVDSAVVLACPGSHTAYYKIRAQDLAGSYSPFYGEVSVQTSSNPPKTAAPITPPRERAFEFALFQNVPNPFNPVATIAYSIPEDGQVSLKVFNVLGQLVSTLVDEYQPAGDKQVTFNASNLPSGVYFYRLQAGSYTAVKKMILAK